jgi:hypothetical protein
MIIQIFLFPAILIFSALFAGNTNYGIYPQLNAQTVASPDLAKVLIDRAIQALQSGNIKKTVMHLGAAEQEVILAVTEDNRNNNSNNYSSLETILLVKDAIQSLQNSNDTTKALVFLDLSERQLGEDLLNIANANLSTTAAIPRDTFLIYSNPSYGIRMQYQYNWVLEGTSYPSGTGGVQITSFYLPDTSIGLPYFRIGTDNLSKEFPQLSRISVNDYLNRSLEHKSSTGFPGFKLLESDRQNSLAGNRAYTIIWTYTNPTYGMRKSIEIGTIIGGKGYFVDYTAAEGKFQKYLPVVQKMINSFEIINSTTGVNSSTSSYRQTIYG